MSVTRLAFELEANKVIAGSLLGTAVGDALGLAYEGMSRKRVRKLTRGTIRHRFLLGRGMVSDDTEQTLMVLRTLRDEPDDVEIFQARLARRFRLWFLTIPAGIGWATLGACGKLSVGFPPTKSGIRSAGNGPAARSAVIGAFFRGDADRRIVYTHAATFLTHNDPRAITGAQLVSLAAATEPDDFLEEARGGIPEGEWATALAQVERALDEDLSPEQFADRLGAFRGVSGDVLQTVPIALFLWLRHPSDFRACVEEAILLGGDTDTVAAIVGGICGAHVGEEGIPDEWLAGIREWPMGVDRMRDLAHGDRTGTALPAQMARNALFLGAVLTHNLRRLLPPYG